MLGRSSFADTVRRAFLAAGDLARPATLSRREPGPYDPVSGEAGEPAASASACLVLPDAQARPRFALTGGLEVGPEEIGLWLTGAGFAPRPGDVVAMDGAGRTVLGVRDLLEAGALYFVVAK